MKKTPSKSDKKFLVSCKITFLKPFDPFLKKNFWGRIKIIDCTIEKRCRLCLSGIYSFFFLLKTAWHFCRKRLKTILSRCLNHINLFAFHTKLLKGLLNLWNPLQVSTKEIDIYQKMTWYTLYVYKFSINSILYFNCERALATMHRVH